MGMVLVCDICHKPRTYVFLMIAAQNPGQPGHICLSCLAVRLKNQSEVEEARDATA